MHKIYIVFVIKADTGNKNAYQILNKLRAIIEALNGNVNFPMTNPSLVELQEKETELAQAAADLERAVGMDLP